MFTFIGFLDKSIKVFNFIKVLQNTQMNYSQIQITMNEKIKLSKLNDIILIILMT